ATPKTAGRYPRLMEQEPKKKYPAHHGAHHVKPKAKHKAKPKAKAKHKHSGSKPAPRQPGERPKAKEAAVAVRDPWADAAAAPMKSEQREAPERRESQEEEEHENPVSTALGLLEDAHLGAEGWFGRHIHGDTL